MLGLGISCGICDMWCEMAGGLGGYSALGGCCRWPAEEEGGGVED